MAEEQAIDHAASPAGNLPSRIAMVISHDVPGGAQQLWQQLGEQFGTRGIDVHFVALQSRAEGEEKGTPWQGLLKSRLTPYTMPRALWLLTRKLRELRADMVISALPAANVLTPVAGWLADVPVRVTSHHSPVGTHQGILRRLDQLLAPRFASQVVCVSQAVADSLEHFGTDYRDKVTVVRNAIPPSVAGMIRQFARQRWGVAGPQAEIVAVGRLAEQKNYPTLLRAMVKVRSGKLTIVGDGPDAEPLQHLATELGLGGKVTFAGRLSHEDTLSLMRTADIFVQPSLYEGHSLALLEAATLGLPMILSNIPTQTEAVTGPSGECQAAIVPTMDHEAWADAINTLIETPSEVARLSSQSLSLANWFSFTDTVDAYLKLWNAAYPAGTGAR